LGGMFDWGYGVARSRWIRSAKLTLQPQTLPQFTGAETVQLVGIVQGECLQFFCCQQWADSLAVVQFQYSWMPGQQPGLSLVDRTIVNSGPCVQHDFSPPLQQAGGLIICNCQWGLDFYSLASELIIDGM